MPKRIVSYIWLWAPVVLWMAFIFYSSSISGRDMPKFDIANIDKLFHFVEYMVLGFLLSKAIFHTSAKPNYRRIFVISVIATLLYGASDEFHQRFVSQRACDVFDLISDLIGGCAGAGLSLSAFASKEVTK